MGWRPGCRGIAGWSVKRDRLEHFGTVDEGPDTATAAPAIAGFSSSTVAHGIAATSYAKAQNRSVLIVATVRRAKPDGVREGSRHLDSPGTGRALLPTVACAPTAGSNAGCDSDGRG